MSEYQKNSIGETLDVVVGDMAEKGWSHVGTSIDPRDTVAIRELFSIMAEHLTIDVSSKPEISVIAPQEKAKALAASKEEMSFHTDNVYLEDPCKSVALFCSVQADEGGVNELVDGLEVVRSLPPYAREALAEQKWHWTHPSTQESSDKFTVVDLEGRLRWWRMSLLNKEMADIAIADVFEGAINRSPNRQSALMQPGDILVTDNTRILHNRSAFVGERRLYRARFW